MSVLTQTSGQCVDVKFSPPGNLDQAQRITSYIVQWDSYSDFRLSTKVGPSYSTQGYGYCSISKPLMSFYSFEICDLHVDKIYFIRVAARNIIELKTIHTLQEATYNINWS